MPTTQSCRTCKYLYVEPDKAGRRKVYWYRRYDCTWEPPAHAVLSDAITKYVSPFSRLGQNASGRFETKSMSPDDGTTCPTWELLVKARK